MSKQQRRAAREAVAAYHQLELSTLIEHVEHAVGRYRAGEIDAFEVDAVIHRYHRAAQRLWVFCDQSGAQVEFTADLIAAMTADGREIDWWQRGTDSTTRSR